MSAVFIAGAGTDVGKTYVAELILRRAALIGRPACALKPVASGLPTLDDPAFETSDPGRLLRAQGLAVDAASLAACNPWRFAAALSPDMAAAAEGRRLPFVALRDWTRAELGGRPAEEVTLVEGIGGIMSPICDDALNLDLVLALDLPSLLVGGTYLGAISHVLTALEAMRARGAPPRLVLVNESERSEVALAATMATIRRFAGDVALESLSRGAKDLPPRVAGLLGL